MKKDRAKIFLMPLEDAARRAFRRAREAYERGEITAAEFKRVREYVYNANARR